MFRICMSLWRFIPREQYQLPPIRTSNSKAGLIERGNVNPSSLKRHSPTMFCRIPIIALVTTSLLLLLLLSRMTSIVIIVLITINNNNQVSILISLYFGREIDLAQLSLRLYSLYVIVSCNGFSD